MSREGTLTLLFAAKNKTRNNAVGLKEYIEGDFRIINDHDP